jgi:four helix bundle protein
MRNVQYEMRNESAGRNVVLEKSFTFAVGIVKAGRRLQLDHKEWVLSKQLIRSGTSIGANIEEAIAAQSKKDFLSKMSIALKEARETHYWLRVIRDAGLGNGGEMETHVPACQELIRLLSSITLSTRENLESAPRARR